MPKADPKRPRCCRIFGQQSRGAVAVNKSDRLSRATGETVYRGFSIRLHPDVPAGRKGRYLAAGKEFARLEHAREYIDSELSLVG